MKDLDLAPNDIDSIQKMEWSKMIGAGNAAAAKINPPGALPNLECGVVSGAPAISFRRIHLLPANAHKWAAVGLFVFSYPTVNLLDIRDSLDPGRSYSGRRCSDS